MSKKYPPLGGGYREEDIFKNCCRVVLVSFSFLVCRCSFIEKRNTNNDQRGYSFTNGSVTMPFCPTMRT
jgi:hypothetical protein